MTMKNRELPEHIIAYTRGDPTDVELGSDNGSWIHVSDVVDPALDLYVKVSDPLMSYFVDTNPDTRENITRELRRVCR